jgi:hypothetical protein
MDYVIGLSGWGGSADTARVLYRSPVPNRAVTSTGKWNSENTDVVLVFAFP